MKNAGFSLLELLIAMIISSMIALLLFQVFNQSTKILSVTDGTSSTYINVLTCYQRLQADLTGAFIPPMGDPELAPEQIKEELPKKTPDLSVKNVFFYQSENQNLKFFTFITHNPMQSYKLVNPCIVRVIYTLKPDPLNKTEFLLTRAQTLKLSIKPERIKDDSSLRSYILLRHIKKLVCEFKAIDVKKLKEQAEQQKTQKQPKTLPRPPMITYTQWPPEETKNDKKDTPKPFPAHIKIMLVYHDPYQDRDTNFVFITGSAGQQQPEKDAAQKVPRINLDREQQKEPSTKKQDLPKVGT